MSGSFDEKFKRYQRGESLSGPQTLDWSEVGWRGDRVHRQIVLTSQVDRVEGLHYEVSSLVSGDQTIPADAVRLRREVYVKGDPEPRNCSGYPVHDTFVDIADALSRELPATVVAADPAKLWVSIDVPPGAQPGIYSGTISIRGDGTNELAFAIHLQVVDLVVPAVSQWSFQLDLWQYPNQIRKLFNDAHAADPIAVWSDDHFALFEPTYRILADAGQKAITAHIKEGGLGGPSMIRWIRKLDGTWTYDYSVFDRYVTSLQSMGIDRQISCFSIVGWNPDTIPFFDQATGAMSALDAPIGSAVFQERWHHFLDRFRTHLDQHGWFDRTVLYMDEVDATRMAQVIDLVKANDPEWKMGLAYFLPDVAPEIRNAMHDLSGLVSVAEAGAPNPVATFYTSCLPVAPNSFVTPQSSPAEMTWMGWHAARDNLDGYLRWAVDLWTTGDPLDIRDEKNTAGDFSLLYHLTDSVNAEAMSSIRLELLREGIQDFEKIKVLRSSRPAASLVELENAIDEFSTASGSSAATTVTAAQAVIRELSTAPPL